MPVAAEPGYLPRYLEATCRSVQPVLEKPTIGGPAFRMDSIRVGHTSTEIRHQDLAFPDAALALRQEQPLVRR